MNGSDRSVIKAVSNYIPDSTRILVFGSDNSELNHYLPETCTLINSGINSWQKSISILSRDSNIHNLKDVDILVIFDIPRDKNDKDTFFQWLVSSGKRIVLSLSDADITEFMTNYAHDASRFVKPCRVDKYDSKRTVSCFIPPKERFSYSLQERKRVLVLSFNNVPNFGDRLGYHLLIDILPSHADITFAHFNPWNVPDNYFDLLILGIGNSIFKPLLKDRLFSLVDRIPAVIGIFGTQYRKAIPKEEISLLLGKLDTWYARHESDIAMYGDYCRNVVHLGDWLITAFPFTQAKNDSTLILGDEIRQDLPLDRMIQKIQQHKTVHSPRIHPLLCALTSADTVRYYEQREYDGSNVSGKFRSMLFDIFQRSYPEAQDWEVDKNAVYNYHAFARRQKIQLRNEITARLA